MRTQLCGRAIMVIGVLLIWLVSTSGADAATLDLMSVPHFLPRHGDATDVPLNLAAATPLARVADGQIARADRIIVRFRDAVSPGERDAVHRAVDTALSGSTAPRSLGQVTESTQVVSIPDALAVDQVVAAYRSDPRVQYAQPDYLRYATDIPNDPVFAAQWGLAKVNAPAAWSVTHGGAAIKIAILDCGIHDTHPDLTGKVVLARDFTQSASGTDDRCNHGTHVAGIASAQTNNDTGVAGMAYNTQLLNGKVLDDTGTGSDSTVAAGVNWAVENGAKVINMSLSGNGTCDATPALRDAINNATAKNVVVVVAAGNTGTAAVQTPASCANALSVASTNQADTRSSFSSYGSWVKVAAPGEAIISTVNPDLNGGNAYAYLSGTSMATPLVAGLVALLWATQRDATATAIVDQITGTADHIAGTGAAWQYGRVNAAAAFTPHTAPAPHPTMPTVVATVPNATPPPHPATVTVTATATTLPTASAVVPPSPSPSPLPLPQPARH